MGYSLTVGEAMIDWNEDCVRVECEPVRLDDAPAFGEPTDYENERWPSYTSWHDAMRELGLVDLMFSERNGGCSEVEYKGKSLYPLIQDHPGVAPITKEHFEYAEMKFNEYKAKHPNHRAEYPPLKPGIEDRGLNAPEDYVDDPTYDGNLCRGEWLLFWLKWAVENCDYPVFVNT